MRKFPLSDRATTIVSIIVGLLLFFHPHLGAQPVSQSADCSGRQGRERELVLRENARRSFLLLRLCDTLVITNDYSRPLYPAPGPHPHHASYPELDPKRNLQPGERFSVRLVRTGNYQLHDDSTEKIFAELTIIGWTK